MSHCRFENTYHDLVDCFDALNENGSLKETLENVNQYEKRYVKKLIELCIEISNEYKLELKKEKKNEDDDK